MMRKLVIAAILVVAVAGLSFFLLTAPSRLDPQVVAALAPGDAVHGEQVFWEGGCASCHVKPGTKVGARPVLTGGVTLKTGFGTFVAPNISPDPKYGIGGWSVGDFANAVMRGVAPDGRHFYPAFPYASFSRMKLKDVADLFAFIKTLPASSNVPPPDQLSFPFNVRRGIGLWKRLYLDPHPVVALPGAPTDVLRGRYLAEGPGHCGECHTPRNALGGLDDTRWLSGARMPDGKDEGKAPNLTTGPGGLGEWTKDEIVTFFQTGFTPDFDSVGGAMVEVQENLAHLPKSDLEAIAAYLKAIPPLPDGYK
jgi:mono/diheme cytochrome c family protein